MSVLGIELVRPQRQPILRRAAGEIVLRQVGPVDRRRGVAAQHDDAAAEAAPPQHLGRRKARRPAADDDDPSRRIRVSRGRGFVCSRFSLTKIRPSRCSTFQQSTGLSAGARSASPLRRSKQA